MLLQELRISRVAADPAIVPEGAKPAGDTGLAYYRLHGSPRMYYSQYNKEFLVAIASRLRDAAADSFRCGASSITLRWDMGWGTRWFCGGFSKIFSPEIFGSCIVL